MAGNGDEASERRTEALIPAQRADPTAGTADRAAADPHGPDAARERGPHGAVERDPGAAAVVGPPEQAGPVRLPRVRGFAERVPRGAPKEEGRALRGAVPRSSHARLVIDAARPDAVTEVRRSSEGRLADLVPIRVGRMAASPFAFLRGSAGLMAYDLARTPVTGIGAQICGDAHAANFGLYADARGGLIIDLNDFDETAHGPWEWDVKRLATSLVLAGREAGADEDACRTAALDAVGAYRRTMRLLAELPVLEAWQAIADEELVSHTDAHDLLGTLERVAQKAMRNTSGRFAAKSTERAEDGGRRFVDAPPVLRRVPDAEAAAVATALGDWVDTLPEDLLPLVERHAIHDVAFRVVGTGSVGTRSYVVLLLDHRGEPLVLQAKEARPSALLPHLPAVGFQVPEAAHEGRRVVLGQRRMQIVSDPLLGWTRVGARPFQVRQFRNRKGSVDPATLAASQLDDYGRMTGALLARAHAHSADPRRIAGYCGKGDVLDRSVADFAVAYADRTEADHADLVRAIRDGRIPAETGV